MGRVSKAQEGPKSGGAAEGVLSIRASFLERETRATG